MSRILYVIGEPGAGKSTLVAELTRGIPRIETGPFWETLDTIPPILEIGRRRDSFSGTDALGMAVQPRVIEWLLMRYNPESDYGFIAEGDRLATASFFRAVIDAGYDLEIAWLRPRAAVAEARRRARALQLESDPQNPTWVLGRRTKVENLAREFGDRTLVLDSEDIAADLAALAGKSELAALLLSRRR